MFSYDEMTIKLRDHSVNLDVLTFRDYEEYARYILRKKIPREEFPIKYSSSSLEDNERTKRMINDNFMGDLLFWHIYKPALISLTTVGCDDKPIFYYTHNYPVSSAEWERELETHGGLLNVGAPCMIGLCVYDETITPVPVDSVRYLNTAKIDERVPDLEDLLLCGTEFYQVYPSHETIKDIDTFFPYSSWSSDKEISHILFRSPTPEVLDDNANLTTINSEASDEITNPTTLNSPEDEYANSATLTETERAAILRFFDSQPAGGLAESLANLQPIIQFLIDQYNQTGGSTTVQNKKTRKKTKTKKLQNRVMPRKFTLGPSMISLELDELDWELDSDFSDESSEEEVSTFNSAHSYFCESLLVDDDIENDFFYSD